MDIKEILKLDPEEILKKLTVKLERKVTLDVCKKQYDPVKHDILDPVKRLRKTVLKATGKKDANGEEIYESVSEDVVRIAIPYQKLIVARSESFMLGNPIELEEEYSKESAGAEQVLEMVKKIWDDNKLDFRNRELAEILLSECEVAELWYLEDSPEYWGDLSAAKYKLRMKILSDRSKDELYPIFSETGDMIAFGRLYSVKEEDGEVKHFDVYTAEQNHYYIKPKDGKWQEDTEKKVESTGKIHVIYYRIDQPDWFDVQAMIDRLETTISNTGDTNDYSGAPITIVQGKVMGFASKGERGKVLEVEKGGDVKYLESSNAPDSVKLEIDTLDKYIKEMTRTLNISPNEISGLGALSGIALKLMFTDAHAKAAKNWGVFGEGVQRRLNLLKHIVGFIDTKKTKDAKMLSIMPSFTPYLPVDEEAWNKMITESLALGAISKRTTAENLTFISDPDQEVERIKEERVEDLGASAE